MNKIEQIKQDIAGLEEELSQEHDYIITQNLHEMLGKAKAKLALEEEIAESEHEAGFCLDCDASPCECNRCTTCGNLMVNCNCSYMHHMYSDH